MAIRLILGDCVEVMRGLPADSVDAIVTDPPAGISFMSKDWDHDKGGRDAWVAWLTEVLAECLRVAKPGAHALIWALPRTSGWTHRAIEDAGWEVRDCVTHLFGSGFPKSLDVGKALDRAVGAERHDTGELLPGHSLGRTRTFGTNGDIYGEAREAWATHTIPATDLARQWDGWGSALKPAAELWYLARKPLAASGIAANVAAYGTGAININATRIESGPDHAEKCASVVGLQSNRNGNAYGEWTGERTDSYSPLGRWPANLILDEDSARALDAEVGERPSGAMNGRYHGFGKHGIYGRAGEAPMVYAGDSGGPSRFFLVAHDDSSTYTSGDKGELPCKNPPSKQSPERGAITGKTDVGIASGESQEVERSTTKSKADGYGNRRTAPSQTDTKSTTQTSTKEITTSPTWNALPLAGTTTTTSDGAKTTNLSRGVSIGTASDAANTDPSLSSSDEKREPTKDIASSVRAPISESGESVTENTTTPTTGNTEPTGNRFFYTAKASRAERNAGLGKDRNTHPCVKSVSLMRWLVRLICPPNGTVFDPFTGSGSTGCACVLEGFSFIGIDFDSDYVEIARRRIEHAQGPMFAAVEVAG